MGVNIGPIVPRPGVSGAKSVEGESASKVTADKVGKIRLPVVYQKRTLQGRQVAHLRESGDLAKHIRSKWDEMTPEQLAEQIIALEDKVALIQESSPAVEKVRKQAQHLHFQFVFPVAKEMDGAPPEGEMPVSFARMIYKAARDVFKTNSVHAFNDLNGVQRREVMRYAAGRDA